MKLTRPHHTAPTDADTRRSVPVRVCYPIAGLPSLLPSNVSDMRAGASKVDEVLVAPREAGCIDVPAGSFLRISSVDGPQVGDLNLWKTDNIAERFFSGKTRALYGTHVSTGDTLYSNLPYMRALATITDDSLDWYGYDADGGSVHDVIGTRCDPYTGRLLSGDDYHHCCHSNLTRALADHAGIPISEAELHVHDVLNVFMLTGFTHDTHQYFMKASPVRPGDYLEFLAHTDITAGLSACPGGDCGDEHSSDVAACFPLLMEVYSPDPEDIGEFTESLPNPYDRSHGRG